MSEAQSISGAPQEAQRSASPRRGRMPLSLRLREALLRVMYFYWDAPVELGRLMWRLGLKRKAAQLLRAAHETNAWDSALGEILCDMTFDLDEAQYALGTVERSAFILRVMARSFPSERVGVAYFENLEAMLRGRARRSEPGKLVFGLGVGRVGSTTLTGIMQSVPGAVATHEIPPHIWWTPDPRQVEFHKRRFRILLHYAPLVFDGAKFWIAALDEFFAEFPGSKAIGLYRDVEANVDSFAKLWAPGKANVARQHSGVWESTYWSPMNPAYVEPDWAKSDPGGAKRFLIRRNVTEHNARLEALAARYPDRLLLVRTEELDKPETRAAIERFVGLPVTRSIIRRNTGSADDSIYQYGADVPVEAPQRSSP